MPTQLREKTKKSATRKELEVKAELFDELVDMIEDRYLGASMAKTEREKDIPLVKVKKMLK